MSLVFPHFLQYPELIYGFSERQHGSMKWSNDTKIYQPCLENRQRFFSRSNILLNQIITTDLVHGFQVAQVSLDDRGKVMTKIDALASNTKDTFLTVTGADCFPVYFYEPEAMIIGLAHVGWKGLVNGIISHTIEKINSISGTSSDSILVGIGPGIRQCHFSVSLNDLYYYDKCPKAIMKNEDEAFIDIPAIITGQCLMANIKKENIDDSNLCTYCLADKYFSYRRDKPSFLEAMIAYIGRAMK